MKRFEKGKTYGSFCEAYQKIKASTATEELPLMNIDMVYIDTKGGTIYHNGIENAVDFVPFKMKGAKFQGDGIRIGLECFPISQKAILDIATLVGLKGEGLSESCRERAALVSKKIAFNSDKYQFVLQDGVVVGIKKNVATCPSITTVIDALPSKDDHLGKGIQGKIVRDWVITHDFYKVAIEYSCLGASETLTPYCIVQDSDTGESSLTITFGAMLSKNGNVGFLPIFGKSYRHNKVITITQIYEDVQYYIIDQFMSIKRKLDNVVKCPPEKIILPKEFTKNLSKQKLKELDMSGDTLYDQIVALTVSTALAAKDLGIKQQNAIMKSLFEFVVLKQII
jgi:hypothetical protein